MPARVSSSWRSCSSPLRSSAAATDVLVVGVTPGRSADLVIEHREPITVAPEGQTIDGVTVVSVSTTGAVIRVDGGTRTIGLTAVRGGQAPASGTITLSADPRGHFVTPGTVNGQPVHFLVDGATYVALSRAEATRLGVDSCEGRPHRVVDRERRRAGLACGARPRCGSRT